MTTTFSRAAVLEWSGPVVGGDGTVASGSGSFQVRATFPRLRGEPAGMTTPEELLAASHATCFGIGLRSVIARRGGTVRQIRVKATITAEKGPDGIRVRSSHLEGVLAALEGVDAAILPAIGREAEEGCTISAALRDRVAITVRLRVSGGDEA